MIFFCQQFWSVNNFGNAVASASETGVDRLRKIVRILFVTRCRKEFWDILRNLMQNWRNHVIAMASR